MTAADRERELRAGALKAAERPLAPRVRARGDVRHFAHGRDSALVDGAVGLQ